jgi:hypothetical protein
VDQILARRDAGHGRLRRLGYGPAEPDEVTEATRPFSQRRRDPAYQAIRGREQQLIDELGGSIFERRSPRTRAGNRIRGVAKANPLGRIYDFQATLQFGRRAKYTGY